MIAICGHLNRMKFSTSLPYAFTEQGAIMAANILNSAQAIEMSVFIVHTFVRLCALACANEQGAIKTFTWPGEELHLHTPTGSVEWDRPTALGEAFFE